MTKTLGDRIRELREEKDLSLRDLSKLTGGLTAAFLSDIEHSRRYPSDENLKIIASALGTTAAHLSEFDTRPPVEEMKRLAAQRPELGIAFRKIVELSPEDLIELASRVPSKDKK